MEQLSSHATTTEPVLWSLGAATTEVHVPWSPCTPREDTAVRSPNTANGYPLLTTTKEKPIWQQRPSTAKINKCNYFFKNFKKIFLDLKESGKPGKERVHVFKTPTGPVQEAYKVC